MVLERRDDIKHAERTSEACHTPQGCRRRILRSVRIGIVALEFGTKVKVSYPKTGKSVIVEINDRGPYVDDRIIDLSRAAAEAIGLIDDGIGTVKLEVQ